MLSFGGADAVDSDAYGASTEGASAWDRLLASKNHRNNSAQYTWAPQPSSAMNMPPSEEFAEDNIFWSALQALHSGGFNVTCSSYLREDEVNPLISNLDLYHMQFMKIALSAF
jgi:hypothetical protein